MEFVLCSEESVRLGGEMASGLLRAAVPVVPLPLPSAEEWRGLPHTVVIRRSMRVLKCACDVLNRSQSRARNRVRPHYPTGWQLASPVSRPPRCRPPRSGDVLIMGSALRARPETEGRKAPST